MSLSGLAASVPEIIANNTVVSAGREIMVPMTETFRKIQNGSQEARAAAGLVPGVTSEPVNCCHLVN